MRILMSSAAVVALAGCGGGSVPPLTPTQQFVSYYDSDIALRETVLRPDTRTRDDAVPSSGRARFDGVATVTLDTRDHVMLLGDARVEVDFARRAVTGGLTDFVGRRDGYMGAQPWTGFVTMEGDIDTARAQQLRAGLYGALFNADDALRINTMIDGDFYDAAGRRASGLSMTARGYVRWNNSTIASSRADGVIVSIVAER